MTSIETKAIETFHEMWEVWRMPTPESMPKALSFYAQEFHGFGSALHEIWRNQADMKVFYERCMQQEDYNFGVIPNWLETRVLSEKEVALWGEMRVEIEQGVKTLSIDPMRMTLIFRETLEGMKIIQSHSSLPDATLEDEIWAGTGKPKRYEEVSVLFTDFVGFTKMVNQVSAQRLVEELNHIFAYFDAIVKGNGLEKLKTIGDAYMAVGGLHNQESGQAIATVQAAKEMLDYLKIRNKESEWQWDMRVGIHSGPVVGGVIGSEKLQFDLWGETVNLASRMESAGAINRINVSAYTHQLIQSQFNCKYRGKIRTKDKEELDMYLVV